MAETDMSAITEAALALKPALLIVDSVQTMYTEDLESAAGTVSQVRECTAELVRLAKVAEIPVFIVAHVTKAGELAGPKIIEHLVDVVLLLSGEPGHDLRLLRASKNRYGTTSEVGAFDMGENGLTEVADLSGALLTFGPTDQPIEGAICAAVCEGSRPLLMEIQALAASAGQRFPRRTPIGVDLARLNMIIAVLERKAGVHLDTKDVYVNVAGGVRPEGTSADLAVAVAIWSSVKEKPLPRTLLAVGEIGLTGELRPVRGAERIVREAAKLGFTDIVLPKRNASSIGTPQGVRVVSASSLMDALRACEAIV